MIPTSASTAREVSAVFFSFYTHDELRKVSVKQISNPQIFDALGHPEKGGLYDPALGPFEKGDNCTTCGLSYFSCPGHFGHIELVTPVFNPTTFATLYRLLKAKCLYCNHFRTSRVLVGFAWSDSLGRVRRCQSTHDQHEYLTYLSLLRLSSRFITLLRNTNCFRRVFSGKLWNWTTSSTAGP